MLKLTLSPPPQRYRLQVRSAYRKKGWALTNAEHIEQCKHDAYLESIQEQKGEGCKMWGQIQVCMYVCVCVCV